MAEPAPGSQDAPPALGSAGVVEEGEGMLCTASRGATLGAATPRPQRTHTLATAATGDAGGVGETGSVAGGEGVSAATGAGGGGGLTVITISLMVPTLVYSFYGMNVDYLPLAKNPFAYIYLLLISILIVLGLLFFINKKR